MNVLGIIPARGGSKRVPNKNIKPLHGTPLIGYTIAVAKKASKLTTTVISTDSQAIADVATNIGGNVPFLRPQEMATDTSGDRQFLIHALQWYQDHHQIKIDAVCLLRPTSPFRTSALIDKGIELLQQSGCDSVRSMTLVEGVHHPYWMFREEEGLAQNFIDGLSIEKFYQSQLLPKAYRLNGCVDIIKTEVLLDSTKPLYGNKMKVLDCSEKEGLDIDTLDDFDYCEWLMSKKGLS